MKPLVFIDMPFLSLRRAQRALCSLTPVVSIGWLVLTVFSLFIACGSSENSIDFDTALENADVLLASGAITEATASLTVAEEMAKQREDWLRILKRRYSAASSTGDWEPFTETGRRAFERYPGLTDFAGLYAYGLLRSGNTEKANSIEREYLSDRYWKRLSDEIWLVSRENPSDESSRRFALPARYEPDFDEDDAALLLQAGERFDDPRFFLDASLIFAGTGEYHRAQTAFGAHARAYPFVISLYQYDAGNYSNALESISPLMRDGIAMSQSETPGDILTMADIAMAAAAASGSASTSATASTTSFVSQDFAAELYATVAAINPGFSWIPYANLARTARTAGSYDKAFEYLDIGIANGHTDRALHVERVLAARESGDDEKALEYLLSMESQHPGSYEVAVLFYLIERNRGQAQRARAAVKEAFYANPRYERIALLTTKLLANARDFEDMELILHTYLSVAPTTDWTDFFSGYLAVHRGNLDLALTNFRNASTRSARWEFHYNIGLVLAGKGKYADARDEFRRASAYTTDTRINARLVLDVARMLAIEGDFVSARREASFASELSDEFTEAKLFLKELGAMQANPTP